MADLRLKTADLTVGGRTYKICCNMNVLADVQEMCGGKLGKGIDDTSVKGLLRWATAMINDARDSLGEKPLTVKQVGRLIPVGELGQLRAAVTELMLSALKAPDGEEGGEKNPLTTQS